MPLPNAELEILITKNDVSAKNELPSNSCELILKEKESLKI